MATPTTRATRRRTSTSATCARSRPTARSKSTAASCRTTWSSACALGILNPERLLTRGFGALFLVGGFGVVVGTLLYHFWRLGEKSRHCFRWASDEPLWEAEGHFLGTDRRRVAIGLNPGDAFDL